MKRPLLFSFALAATLAVPGIAAAGTDAYVDQICPEASTPVHEFNIKTKDATTSLDEGLGLTERVILVYQKCAGEKQRKSGSSSGSLISSSDNFAVEGMHYAQTRAAFYQLALGRLLTALRRYDDARLAFNEVLKSAKDTLDWKAPALMSYSSNYASIHPGSVHDQRSGVSDYRGAATYAKDQATSELEKLDKIAPVTTTGATSGK